MFFVLVTRDQLGGVEELEFIRNPITRPWSLVASTLARGRVRFQILYIIFLLVGMKRGMVFISDFKKWIMYTFMAHPSGWDIKYT